MTLHSPADHLHRLVKQAIDSGAADSLEAAQALFAGYRLTLSIGADEARQSDHQSALLTAVALSRRIFLGGVTVQGPLDVPLMLDLPLGGTLEQAVRQLGGRPGAGQDDAPKIGIGGARTPRSGAVHLRTCWWDWRGGTAPAYADVPPNSAAMPLAPMLAAALAVSEAFFHVRGGAPVAGRRTIGLSLWSPGEHEWLDPAVGGPPLERLPASLWLIGLGHLGQAYLWALSLLPYARPDELQLVLQDVDEITPSTESTSVLTNASMVGRRKTRTMAQWAENRGFAARILERYFDAGFRRRDDEPSVALCGLDNALGRRALDKVGFEFIVEAGLGRGHRDFHTLRLHTLPAQRSADDIWKLGGEGEDVSDRPGYRKLLADGTLDQCGVTLLAGKAVGAPFVGAAAACLAIAELLRLLHQGPIHQLIDLDLLAVGHQAGVLQVRDFSAFNPGFTAIRT
ncbi:MAG TPA: hypothetical protein VG248_08250 [Caulobacteraceae bacterium]|jgi:hypothetical protein|nr:hypothetical protein [Caulobacteraceae bacterium]